ncbi:uncharacterized protein BDR25DRAFT_357849 [Lindgomyces ingoldianus]|uniref:Uncharacterized protein n=1 Tax=Lindgomyces ingoldianus TaxID=673940 RepID=A0ACB6QNI7_9PLEO|nr:uncharacterized protein BDR25DRAFT_357849 [Lindgomyces ingoldianus]KAF2468100.1 hypothetical protein BDR25DRAFT_357849 [Lindgomyces ingoldianus]
MDGFAYGLDHLGGCVASSALMGWRWRVNELLQFLPFKSEPAARSSLTDMVTNTEQSHLQLSALVKCKARCSEGYRSTLILSDPGLGYFSALRYQNYRIRESSISPIALIWQFVLLWDFGCMFHCRTANKTPNRSGKRRLDSGRGKCGNPEGLMVARQGAVEGSRVWVSSTSNLNLQPQPRRPLSLSIS